MKNLGLNYLDFESFTSPLTALSAATPVHFP